MGVRKSQPSPCLSPTGPGPLVPTPAWSAGHWGTLDGVDPLTAPSEILIQLALVGPGSLYAKTLPGCSGELLGWGTPSPSPLSCPAFAWANPLLSEHISTELSYRSGQAPSGLKHPQSTTNGDQSRLWSLREISHGARGEGTKMGYGAPNRWNPTLHSRTRRKADMSK